MQPLTRTVQPNRIPSSAPVWLLLGVALLCLSLLPLSRAAAASFPGAHPTAFNNGPGPAATEQGYLLLTPDANQPQANALAFEQNPDGRFERHALNCRIQVTEGAPGASFMLLNTEEYGQRGPAPFLKDWAEPNLTGSFAVGLDLHNPPVDEPHGPGGNYSGQPERELSLHWNGREIANRFVPVDFRGEFAELSISLRHVNGGAEVTVSLAGETVFADYFVPGLRPYPARLAIGAGSLPETSGTFEVRDLRYTQREAARLRRAPLHIELFNHVLTDHQITAHRRQVQLPPLDWAFGRIILTLDIHDAGKSWDPWDRNGALYLIDASGQKHDILPFITPFRTPGRWQADVSHFRPWLSGEVTFEISTTSDGQEDRGFMLSAALDFYHGEPELVASRVIPLWHGTARYQSAANHYRDFFQPQTVSLDSTTKAARLYLYASGHSPVGEFTPHQRTLTFLPDRNANNGEKHQFSNQLWKTDNYLNPVRPQRGTWKSPRAGWAPGDLVHPWRIDLSPYLIPGKTAELRYQPQAYDFSSLPEEERPSQEEINRAVLLVRAYLVLYSTPEEMRPAPMIEVLKVLPGTNGERHGIQAGDLLLGYDGKFPDSIEQLQAMTRTTEAAGQEQVALDIYRDGKPMTLELEPGLIGIQISEEVLSE